MVMVTVAVVVVAGAVVLLSHHAVAFEQSHAQQQRQRHLPLHSAQDAGIGLDRPQLPLHALQPLFIDQVCLVEQDHVAVHDLGTGHLPLQHLAAEILRINQGDDRIQPGGIAQIAAQEGHRHRQRIGQACGFHYQVVDRVGAIEDAVHSFQQLAVDRAADAAVAQLHHVVACGDHQFVVDADLAELIHQHGGLQSLLIAENVVEEGGFARAQEAGEDRHRQG